MSNLMDDLDGLSESWEEAETSEGGSFFELPEGEHEVVISDVEVEYSKNDRLQIVYSLTVTDGEFKNKTVKKFAGLDDPGRLSFVKGDLKRLGISCENMGDLPEVLDNHARDLLVLINVVKTTKKGVDYTNIYFNKVLDSGSSANAVDDKPTTTQKKRSKKTAEPEPEKEESPSLIGKKASFKEGKKTYTGLITDVIDDMADFESDDDGEVWEIAISDLIIVKDEPEEESPRRRRRSK